MQAKRGGLVPQDLERLREGLSSALAEALPDLEPVDRQLELGEGLEAELVAVDAAGRLVLVLLVPGEGDAAPLAALDALAFARANRALLAAHLGAASLRPDLAPRVVLVAEGFSPQLVARLEGLQPDSVRCFDRRVLASSRGRRVYLVPVSPARAGEPSPISSDPGIFLAALDATRRPLGELLVRRIARIDEQLACTALARSASWRLGNELLGSLAQVEDSLEGHAPPHAPRRIESEADAEGFLEQVLGRYLELFGGSLSAGPRSLAGPPGESSPAVPDADPEELQALNGP